MFLDQFLQPSCVGTGAESTEPVGGSPVFLSFSGVTQGNRAVTGLLSFGLFQKLATLVHRSRVVPCQCFNSDFAGKSLGQFQR